MEIREDFCTSPRQDGSWAVKRCGDEPNESVYSTKSEAWKETRRLARGAGSQALLHDRDGTIHTRNSYESDSTIG